MLFNSYEFIFIFLPVALIAFYGFCYSGLAKAAIWWIGLSSIVFYGMWDIRFVPLLIGSILFNYVIGIRIVDGQTRALRKAWLILGLVGNLGLLGFFKYTSFFLGSFAGFFGIALTVPNIILPIGISFFTFTQIAYLVDCQRGTGHHYRFSEYLLFVTFFPHLVAGPILHHNSIIPQLARRRFTRPNATRTYMAVVFFSIGLFKKVLIADSLSPYVGPLFANAQDLTVLEGWSAALLYTFQLYFDFSAYSDMAVGLGLMLNVRIPINFNSPYKAVSIIDFWRRWHISLSRFLRNYLYIPLGGNRKGEPRRFFNLLTTMLLGGLWHGAGWTFVVWGGLHGIYLCINHLWQKLGLHMPRWFAWPLTFLAVIVGWVFFRAENMNDALHILMAMAGLKPFILPDAWRPFVELTGLHGITYVPELKHLADPGLVIVALICLTLWTALAPNTQQFAITRRPRLSLALVFALMAFVSVLNLGSVTEFLYFQF